MSEESVSIAWPRKLILPPPEVTAVYLDLNHWIALAKAQSGHSTGRDSLQLLDACRRAKLDGSAIFVLSGCIYMEMLKIRNPKQRRILADLMEELTDFNSLISRVVVMGMEFDAALEVRASLPTYFMPVNLIGRGVLHANALEGNVRVRGPNGDVTAEVRARVGEAKFDAQIREGELKLQRSTLRGPTDEEIDELRSLGWKPESTLRVAEARAEEERAQAQRFRDENIWAPDELLPENKARFRDAISAREFIIEWEGTLRRGLQWRGISPAYFMSTLSEARAFSESIPSNVVAIELKTDWHRNRDKHWTANDMFDIDALAVAVPYCDIVVTDKACWHTLTKAGLGDRMHTAILRSLKDLPNAIQTWHPWRP